MSQKHDRHREQILGSAEKAVRFSNDDPETALLHARKAVEAICRDVYEKEFERTSRNLTLGKLIDSISREKPILPNLVMYSMRNIQNFGGVNAHENMAAYLKPVLEFFPAIITWYFEDYRKESIPTQLDVRKVADKPFFPPTGERVRPLSELDDADEITLVHGEAAKSRASHSKSRSNAVPLILRNGKVITSIDDLMEFAKTNPNTVRGESRAIATWLETLGYSMGESLEIQLKMHFSAIGKNPDEITSEDLPDFSKSRGRFTLFEGETPPPPSKAKAGDVWIHPVDRGEMVFVPAGMFVMGTPKEKLTEILKMLKVPDAHIQDFFDETPARVVYLDAYWIDKYPITNAQFADFIEDAKPTPPKEIAWRYPHIVSHARSGGGDYPIHDISLFEALAYCDWVGKILPTEAQWEKAARGDKDDRQLPWGNEVRLDWMNTIETSHPFPDGVEVYKHRENISPYGCVQMVGNIDEWCLDAYDPNYYSVPNNTHNPTGPETSRNSVVVRGGSTAKPLAFARTSSRNHCPPNKQGEFIGFRCVWIGGFTRNWGDKIAQS